MFADDTTLYSTGINVDTLVYNVNHDLKQLSIWFKANKLSLNVSKTNSMLFSRQKGSENINIKIDSKEIESKKTFKFLGILVDNKLTWSEHINHIFAKASRALYVINSLKHILKYSHLINIYNNIFQPYITYGILLWGGTFASYIKKLEVKQKRAIRVIHGASYNAHSLPLFQKSNILRIKDLYTLDCCVFMKKYLNNSLPINISRMLKPNSEFHHHNTRQRMMPHKPKHKSSFALRSIYHCTSLHYSKLPSHIKSISDEAKFRKSVKCYITKES